MSDSFTELVEQAGEEQQNPKPDVVHQRYIGCLVGCAFGFIASLALFLILLLLDQAFAKPSDPDFAKPLGVMVFVFAATIVGGILGVIFWPFLCASLNRAKAPRRK